MIKFSSLPISRKIISILVLVTVISLLTGFGVHVALDVSSFRKDAVANTALMARIVGDYCVVDIVFDASSEASATLRKLSTNPEVGSACIYGPDERLFAYYAAPGHSCAFNAPKEHVAFRKGMLQLTEPIIFRGKDYGRIVLEVSTSDLNRKIRNYLTTMALLSVALILISFLLAMMLQRFISAPLLELTRTTRQISASRDYSLRVRKTSEDEIGMLCDEFNRMLGRIEEGKEERDRAEAALRESETRYRNLVEFAPEAIFLEQNGRIQYANPAAVRLSGYASLEELQQKGTASLFQEPYPGRTPMETSLIRRDESVIDVEATVADTILDGKPAVQVIARDITESKNLRTQAERVQRLAALGEFSAIIAHEIRNSLGAITLNLRTLTERVEIPEPYQKTFRNMELGANRIQEVVKGVLDFARPAPPSPKMTNIHRILDSSIHTLESELSSVEIVREYALNAPDVFVDPVQIGQVFVNLLLNACGAINSRRGGKITISTRLQESLMEVKVADNGSGIPRENLDRIFDPFFTTKSAGAGLGLAVVARILDQHRAAINVESKPDEGSVFTLRFPIGAPL